MTFAPTTNDQPGYAQWHRYGAGPVVVDARGPGTPANRWWAGMDEEAIYLNGKDRVGAVPLLPFCGSPPVVAPTGGLETGSVLTATAGSWDRAATLAYQWLRDGRQITNANAASYTLQLDDRGSVLACLVTGTNTSGSESQISNSTEAAAWAPPLSISPPVVSGSLFLGSELTVTVGEWVGDPSSYAYQWLRNGVAILGANGSSYVLITADHGAFMSCLVTGTNAGGSTVVASNAVGPATTSAPVVLTNPAVTPTTGVLQGTVLTSTSGTWGGASGGFSYQWLRNGADIPGATESSYTATTADDGAMLSCEVTTGNVNGTTAAVSNAVGPVSAPISNLMSWNGQVMTWYGQNLTWN